MDNSFNLFLGVLGAFACSAIEHPEVVADRILNFARAVGREFIIA